MTQKRYDTHRKEVVGLCQ